MPQIVNLGDPMHLMTSELMSASAINAHERLRNIYSFFSGWYYMVSSVRSILIRDPFATRKVAFNIPNSSSCYLRIEVTKPLAVPAGINPKVVFSRNSSLSSLERAPLTASWMRPSPDTVITQSYSPGLSSFYVISKACIALSVGFNVTSM
jgi:hypothetical protein